MRRGKGAGRTSAGASFEGRTRYTPGETAPGAVKPVITRSHSDGNCSITGGVVVRDPALPALRGRYVFGDFCRGVIQPHAERGARARCTTRKLHGRQPLLVRRGRARARLRRLARRAGLPARAAMSVRARRARHRALRAGTRARSRCRGPTPGSSAATRRGWSTRGRRIAAHVDAVAAEVAARGGAGGIALTHDHGDHSEGVLALPSGSAPRSARAATPRRALGDGDAFGPFEVLASPATPTTTSSFVAGRRLLHRRRRARRGQRVRRPGACASTSTALRRLRALALERHLPRPRRRRCGDPSGQARRVPRAPRRARAQAAGGAGGGRASEDELLDAAWADAPAALRPAAAITLARTWRSCGRRGLASARRAARGRARARPASGVVPEAAASSKIVAQRVADGADAAPRRARARSPRARARPRC